MLIIIFFRRPNAFLFGPNELFKLCKTKGKNEAMERNATSSKTILSAKKSQVGTKEVAENLNQNV